MNDLLNSLPPKNLVDSKRSLTHVRKGVRVRLGAQKYKYRNTEIQKYNLKIQKFSFDSPACKERCESQGRCTAGCSFEHSP